MMVLTLQVENGKAQAANFPFCTIEPNVGIVAVPDPRLHKLSDLSKSQRAVPASIEFVDIAGLVKGASQGEVSLRISFFIYLAFVVFIGFFKKQFPLYFDYCRDWEINFYPIFVRWTQYFRLFYILIIF